jgi:hypothetical protein
VARRYATSAGIATFFALLVVLARPMFTKVDATVALTGSGIKHVTALCGKAPPGGKITARVDPEALDDALVLLDDAPCPDKTKRTLRLAKGDIAGTATN